jgi:hypothetical protein
MKKAASIAAMIATLVVAHSTPASADDSVLGGVEGLACEALLCLSSSVVPGACSPSLSYYFGIVKRTLSQTLSARLDFLNLCPVASQSPEMQSLASAISQGAGRCDTGSLNQMLYYRNDSEKTYISNQYPGYCSAYYTHSYTNFVAGVGLPRYVGIPERGGYWVEAKDYTEALAEYNARIELEDKQRERDALSAGWN